eukprot:2742546-Pleurochrysis_carterae.AAC.2
MRPGSQCGAGLSDERGGASSQNECEEWDAHCSRACVRPGLVCNRDVVKSVGGIAPTLPAAQNIVTTPLRTSNLRGADLHVEANDELRLASNIGNTGWRKAAEW